MKKEKSYTLFIIVLLLILRDYVPYLSTKVPLIASLILYTVAYFSFYSLFGSKVVSKYFFLFFVPFVDVVFSIFNQSTGTFPELAYGFIQLFVWAFVCEYIINCKNSKITNYLFYFFVLVIILTSITTYYGCMIFPGASRALATGLNDDADLRTIYSDMNIGGFTFVYNLVIIMPFLFNILKSYSDKQIFKIFIVLMILLFFSTIYYSEYSIAILLSVLSLSIFVLPQKISIQKGLFIIVSLFVFMFIFSAFLPSLFEMFARNTESYDVSSRMEEVSDMLNGKQVYGDTHSRMLRWENSLMSFASSPIIGTGTNGGGHSMILDHMAKYGLFGIIMLIIQFRALFNIILKPLKNTNHYTAVLLMYFLNFVMCLVNTYFLYTAFILFVPLAASYLKDYKYRKV